MARDTLDPPVPPHGRGARAVGVFFIFAIVGPPVGGLIVLAFGFLMSARSGGALSFSLADVGKLLYGFLFISMFSYLFGGLQAAATGLVAAIAQYCNRLGRVPFVPVLLAGLVTGGLFIALMGAKSQQPVVPGAMALFVALHLGSAICCWLIANLLLRPSRPRQLPAAA